LADRPKPRLRAAPTIAIGLLTLVLCLGIGLVYLGGDPAAPVGPIGYVAMGLGLLAAIMLGVGLVLLPGNRRDWTRNGPSA